MSAKKGLNLTLKIWRQKNNKSKGQFETYKISDVSTDSSFLEMLDMLNEQLVNNGSEPVAFDHDCREGICGMCSLYINGRAHGPDTGITTCQLHMRMFKDGETITIEPWRSAVEIIRVYFFPFYEIFRFNVLFEFVPRNEIIIFSINFFASRRTRCTRNRKF